MERSGNAREDARGAVREVEPPFTEEELLTLVRHGARFVARMRGISDRQFRTQCHRLGFRAGQYRTALKRNLIPHLLGSDLSLDEVAHELGFSDTHQLCRFLRRHFGVTATGLRDRLRPRTKG
jgi:AraC-like DNA-binding protein